MSAGPGDFFEAAHEVFLSAGATTAREDYSIGGLVVRLEIAGTEMRTRLTRAFAHLRSPSQTQTNFTICAWDNRAAKKTMVAPPWHESDYGPRGEIRGFNTDRFQTAFDHGTDALSMIDHERHIALFWTRDAANLPTYETGAPFRAILSWWAQANGRLFIHCGAIGNEKGAGLLAGAGGAGKSTTALLCLQAGSRYLADDYCLLQPGPPSRVFSLYNSAKLAHHPQPGFPKLETLTGENPEMDGGKQLFFLNETCPERLMPSLECRVLFLPRVSGCRDTSIEPAPPGEALRALGPSTIFQLSGAGATAFQRLSDFVRTIPVRRLNLGTDPAQIPERIEACLAKI